MDVSTIRCIPGYATRQFHKKVRLEIFFFLRIQFVIQNVVVVFFCYCFFLTLLNMKEHLRMCEVTQEAYKHGDPELSLTQITLNKCFRGCYTYILNYCVASSRELMLFLT